MIKDRVAFDLPAYSGLLAGHYKRGHGYERRRQGGTDDWLLIMTLAGYGRIGTVNGDRLAGPHSLHLISPGTTHDYGILRGADEWEILWVHFHPQQTWLTLLHWQEVAPGLNELQPVDFSAIEDAFREVLRLYTTPGPYRLEFAMNSLERLLLICASQAPNAERRIDSRIQTALDYIHAHPQQAHSAKSLSSRASLSVSRFSHLFKAEVGLAQHQYVMQKKLQHAQHLLTRTSLNVTEVAYSIGMDPAELSQRFKQHFGLTPREYRSSNLKP